MNPRSTLPGDYFDNVARFQEAERDVYGKGSIYAQDVPFSNFGFRQPYVWTSLDDSDFKKFAKRYDNRGIPFGSTLQDEERLGKMLISGHGLKFLAKQFLLQAQNPFDETRAYNPLSVNIAATGFINPKRHLNGGVLGSIMSLFGMGAKSDGAPKSTVGIQALSDMVKGDGAGLLREETAKKGLNRFTSIWDDRLTDKGGGLLEGLMSKFGSVAFGGVNKTGNFTYRKDELAPLLLTNDVNKDIIGTGASILRKGSQRTLTDNIIHRWTKSSEDSVEFQYAPDKTRRDERDTDGDASGNLKTKFNQSIVNKKSGDPKLYQDENIVDNNHVSELKSTFNNQYSSEIKNFTELNSVTKETGYYKTGNSIKYPYKVSEYSREDRLLFPDSSRTKQDLYNINRILSEDSTKIDDLSKKDIIPFYFHDIINKEYLIFRATLKGLSQNTTPEWNETKYLGRADRVYTYNGVTRDLSFSFRAYAASRDEMGPMWDRIDRLQGMCYPTNTDKFKFGESKEFSVMIPPFIRLTIGDIYNKVPTLIKSFSMSIPDESPWEILGVGNKFPMMADISINVTLLEEEIAKNDNVRWKFEDGQPKPRTPDIEVLPTVQERNDKKIENDLVKLDEDVSNKTKEIAQKSISRNPSPKVKTGGVGAGFKMPGITP